MKEFAVLLALVLVSCSSREADQKVAVGPPTSEREEQRSESPDTSTVPLIISNQSFDHPDAAIAVTVDDEEVVDSVFPVEGQHSFTTYDLRLEPGRHEMLATSDAGARLSQTIEVVADEPLYLVLDHWTAEEPGQEPAYFDLTVTSQPPGFG